jgi:hypothetical protein
MIRRLDAHRLVLIVVAGMIAGGCDHKVVCRDLCPESFEVRLVFVNARSGNGLAVDDPSGRTPDPSHIDGNDLTYGLDPNVGECEFDGRCEAGRTCDTALFVCVDASGKQPGVSDAIAAPTEDGGAPLIQIVFNELVRGDTVETCVKESNGACVDVNHDGIPDRLLLVPGVVTVSCGSGFSWQNGPEDGEYDPSGNLFVPIDKGFEGIGPRLYVRPPVAFPYDADCELALSPTITDKNGRSLEDPGPIRWHTEARP